MAIVVGRVRFLNVGPAGGAKLVLRDVTDGVDETFLLQPRRLIHKPQRRIAR